MEGTKMSFKKSLVIPFLILLPITSYGAWLIPPYDFTYEGSFRVPDGYRNGIETDTWKYYSGAFGYNPKGDGGHGTLLGGNHSWTGNKIEEISVPTPIISKTKTVSDLNRATVVQPFTDITQGYIDDGHNMGDVTYLPAQGQQQSGKLYWVHYEWYLPAENDKGFGWSDTNFDNLNAKGEWRVSAHAAAAQKYIMNIPSSFADTYLSGQYLGVGRYRQQGANSRGPTLFSMAPWNDGNPPADGSTLTSTKLLYPDENNPQPNETWYSESDYWGDGVWIDIGGKEAVIFAGAISTRTDDERNGKYPYEGYKCDASIGRPGDYYPECHQYSCDTNGYFGSPSVPALLFYDTADIAAVAKGQKNANEITPYAIWQITRYTYNTLDGCKYGGGIKGAAYDEANNRLYLLQSGGDGTYPLIHVFSVSNSGNNTLDTIAPSPPTNVTNNSANISWTASTDNVDGSSNLFYLILKRYNDGKGLWRPVLATRNTSLTDPGYTAGDQYQVVALDANFNHSDDFNNGGEDSTPPARPEGFMIVP
jgi:hypothetical protein